jgi:hypothetical protein
VVGPVDGKPDGAVADGNGVENVCVEIENVGVAVENVGVENVGEFIGVVDVGDAVVDGESVDEETMLLDVVPIVEGNAGV